MRLSRLAPTLALILAAPAALAQTGPPVEQGPKEAPHFEPAFPLQTRAPAVESGVTFEVEVEVLAEGLVHPWGVAVLPDGAKLVTERPGRLRLVTAGGDLVEQPIDGVPEVLNQRQGGLLDVAPGPDFTETRMVYLTYSKPLGDGMSVTAAARGRLSDDRRRLTEVEDIFVQQPPSPSPMHYGSRILFDGDGHAFVTTGEHFTREERDYAQDLDKTYGKVVRINLDGTVPLGNPFADRQGAVDSIWSYGHRNIQGADIRPSTGQLWTIEHGPKGGDELNLIEPGVNYGWPVISYGVNYDGTEVGSGYSKRENMRQPRYYWDPVIAPGGMLFYQGEMFADWQGDLIIASLVPGGIVRLEMEDDTVTGEERLLTDRGRIRDVATDAEGAILAVTDKKNGALLRLTPGGD